MRVLITAGPASEFLDQVRRITNHSTGQLGSFLADFFASNGHQVYCCLGTHAHHLPQHPAVRVLPFTGNTDLATILTQWDAEAPPDVVFHAAALADFRIVSVTGTSVDGVIHALPAGKIPSRLARLELVLEPAVKLLPYMREWFPQAGVVGWKYEVDGPRADCLALAHRQLASCRTQLCVANGPAYGEGFGACSHGGACEHLGDTSALAHFLLDWAERYFSEGHR